MSSDDEIRYVDPDPFAVVSAIAAVGALILQFVQVRHELRTDPSPDYSNPTQDAEALSNLETSLEDLKSRIRIIERTIERGSPNSDKEYYEATFRISSTKLHLETSYWQNYNNNISYLLNAVAQVSAWINNMIARNRKISIQIGDALSAPLSETARNLNHLIGVGGSNGAIVGEVKQAIDELLKIIDDKGRRDEN